MKRMKILIISNQHADAGKVGNPVLRRMIASLRKDERVEAVDFLLFDKARPVASLRAMAAEARRHDVAHVHFGGLYALAVWAALLGARCPKVITFHGTDIHARAIRTASSMAEKVKIRLNQWASFACIALYTRHAFVAGEMRRYLPAWLRRRSERKGFVQRLGVDYALFTPEPQQQARQRLGIGDDNRLVLFSDVSHTNIKRRDLAEKIVALMPQDYRLLVMTGVPPEEVPVYINASDLLLLTSDEEGSPNIIRECLALNRRVYSVEVGDARQQLAGLRDSMIISREPEEAARQIADSLSHPYTDDSRDTCRQRLDLDIISRQVADIYLSLISPHAA